MISVASNAICQLQNHNATPTREDVSQDTKENESNQVQNLIKGKIQLHY
jgi:hypothetical protein